MFLCGLTVFTAASTVCGLASSQGMLIAARFAQGAGGAMTSSVILRDDRDEIFHDTEALDMLLARMENDRDRLVVIIAGYRNDIDRLLETNDGLRSRFSTRIEFDSYSPEEIVDIAIVLAAGSDSTPQRRGRQAGSGRGDPAEPEHRER